ncbi:hypothetical protein E0H26_08710 [Micromonospora zingiberis]|uniref:Class I SAM-dependent methyltransferase n=1 Tax=Micromonospora zingiberis TaxID=2053011 RepID=A0A4R0GS12_9ACTN|nr:hypothetical protein E0H26_08710 [Micromonospora zingiberis]
MTTFFARIEVRRALVAGLAGRVIEVGAGNGRMFPHYRAGHRHGDHLRWLRRRATAPVPLSRNRPGRAGGPAHRGSRAESGGPGSALTGQPSPAPSGTGRRGQPFA